MSKKGTRELIENVLSDEKIWIAFAASIGGLLNDSIEISAASAIAALSIFGSKAMKEAVKNRRRLRQSPYHLIYSIVST